MLTIKQIWGDSEISLNLYGVWDEEKQDWVRNSSGLPYQRNNIHDINVLRDYFEFLKVICR